MIFAPAVEDLNTLDGPLYGPKSFRDYVREHDLSATRTARYISVNNIDELDSLLREHDIMVLRVGSAPNGTGTAFLLVEAPNGISEYFLKDTRLFKDQAPEQINSPLEEDRLLSFSILPTLSETSLVNFGLASGALAEALRLDTSGSLPPPATGQSTFTFELRPHSEIDKTVTHRAGQIEIDTLFGERRNGDMALFVIEAKTGSYATLAAHKLVYPILAIADAVPVHIDIIPVYLRCRQVNDRIIFDTAECRFPDPRNRLGGLDELAVQTVRSIEIERDLYK